MIRYDDIIGIPFRHKGRDAKTGFDCWGLVIELYRRNGIELVDPVPDYDKDWDKKKSDNLFLENYHRQWRKLDEGEKIELLDLVFFGTEPSFPTHMGVIVERGKVLHCNRGHGVIVSRLLRLEEKIQGYYRLKEVS